MSTILGKGIIRGGQVVVEEPIDLPDGSEVTILGRSQDVVFGADDNGPPSTSDETSAGREANKRFTEVHFTSENEQSDDPEVVQQWIDELRSIPPLRENPEKETELQAWDETMRRFNIEAVRKQFELS
jgi:hypothetical protein